MVNHPPRQHVDEPSDRPTFVSLNRYEAKKNVALAIEAFAKLRRLSAYRDPSVRLDELRLVIAGTSCAFPPAYSQLMGAL
jgi:glycosyltransferase involved in cell wall biosynthesis